jgi:aminopeptidase 2
MQPTAARSAFPCWDEPALKATFAITLVSPAKLVNLSNMSVRSEEVYTSAPETKTPALAAWLANLALDEGWKITQFDTTPRVSTYLVAWALGPFEFLETTYTSPLSGDTRPLRIYGALPSLPLALSAFC